MILPNVNNTINESDKSSKTPKYVFQPMDWVIIKENGMKAQVYNVCNDGFTGKLTALTIIASDGRVYDCAPDEIVPDPLYMDNIAGRVINSQPLSVPRLAECDIDPNTRMTRKPENDKPVKMADYNGPTVQVVIVAEGQVIGGSHKALVEDIANSRKMIRVINEENEVEEYDALKDIQFKDYPYAVIVDGDGKPVRTIKIDPVSYINAGEDDMVRCVCGTNETEFPKRVIDVLS